MQQQPIPQPPKDLSGIAGWLVLPALSLILNIILTPVLVVMLFVHYNFLKDQFGTYLPGLLGFTIFQAIECILLGLAALYIATLIFKKKRIVPKLFMIWLAASLVSTMLDYGLEYYWAQAEGQQYLSESYLRQALNDSARIVGMQIPATIIWIAYFMQSKRVKATFVN